MGNFMPDGEIDYQIIFYNLRWHNTSRRSNLQINWISSSHEIYGNFIICLLPHGVFLSRFLRLFACTRENQTAGQHWFGGIKPSRKIHVGGTKRKVQIKEKKTVWRKASQESNRDKRGRQSLGLWWKWIIRRPHWRWAEAGTLQGSRSILYIRLNFYEIHMGPSMPNSLHHFQSLC